MFKKGNLSLGKYPSPALPCSMLGYTENYEHKHLGHGVGGKRKREVKGGNLPNVFSYDCNQNS